MITLKKLFSVEGPVVVAVLLFLNLGAAHASNVPAGFTETVVPGPFAGLWAKPVGSAFDATGRMFVWERLGRIWLKGPTETNFTQLFSIEEEEGDEGLLGFALDPNFTANGYIYLLYVVDRHHLLYFGTTNYNPNVSQEDEATIGRLTRYTCVASNDFKTVDPASRLVLLGDSKTNGVPVCDTTHTVGSIVFGTDGTLLLSTGDAASFTEIDLGGAVGGGYAAQALADGIIRPKENVGAYRSQLVDCLGGKVLRLDPTTGNGLPSNPFYDAANPRAPRSRVWALGVRNPFRMTLRPESGSHHPADGNPGVLYLGDVGWDTKECLKVITGPAQNFGWPLYEGLSATPNRGAATYDTDVPNLDATNALCGGYFSFRQLLHEDSTNPAAFPPFNHPCNASVKIPTNLPQFLHHRPALDWEHGNPVTRTPTFDSSGNATLADVGAPGSPVGGAMFAGNCSVAGTWYDGPAFPASYRNKYFHADWGQNLVKLLSFNTNNQPTLVEHFATALGPVVSMTQHPFDGSLYYVLYDGNTGTVWQVTYTGNRTPVPALSSDKTYGPGPLTVQFTGNGSSDPDGQALTYLWNFGDGTATSTAANPPHIFSSPGNSRTNYTVTLTVTDTGSLSASATLNLALNDTPPTVTITSPTNGGLYSVASNTPFNLAATVGDAESADAQLKYEWQTVLHHNDHNHVEATSTNHVSSTIVDPAGCDGINIYYCRIVLTVTDPNGLATVREVRLFPNCGTTDTPPAVSDIANQTTAINQPTLPLAFTISDAQVASANLQLSAVSSNAALVPAPNLVFGGYGSNRTLTLTPAPSATGTTLITLNVNDGPNDVAKTFSLTVAGTNTPPTLSTLANLTTLEGTPTAANPFTVGDANAPAASLAVSGSAANSVLVPPGNITFGGSGSNRTVTVTPAAGQSGSTIVTVAVSDGQLSASNSFTLAVTNLPSSLKSVTNATVITILDAGAAAPYPSVINISGMTGVTTNVTVTLRNFSHAWTPDVDVLLVGPGGQKVVLMSDSGFNPASNVTLTFSDTAATSLPSTPLASGTFKPTNLADGSAGGDNFPAPAPAAPFATALTNFNGTNPNGAWSLHVFDDGPGDTGSFAGGWSLTLASAGVAPANGAPVISAISNQFTLVNTPTAALPFSISDAETAASNLVLSVFTSNAGLVPTNKIILGGGGTNRTVTVTPTSNQLGSATIYLTVSDGTLIASNSFVLTVDPAPLAITENSTSRMYGITNPPLSGSVVGLQAGDNITASFISAATTNSPVAAYVITFTLADPGSKLGNYVVTTNNGTLTVTNAPLTATAGNQSRAYGQPNPVFTISYAGFVNGEGTNVLNVLPAATTVATTTSAPGGYAITVTGGTDDNYLLSRVPGTLTITAPGSITITTVELLDATHLRLAGTGDANVTYTIQASADLDSWSAIGTATADGAGAFEFVDAQAGGFFTRFYRVVTP